MTVEMSRGPERDDDAVPRALDDLRVAKDGAVPLAARSPSHTVKRDELKLNTASVSSGRCRNAKNGDRVEPEPALHTSVLALAPQKEHQSSSVTSAISASETAEPNGQSRAVVNWFCTRLPTMTVRPPPSRSGVR